MNTSFHAFSRSVAVSLEKNIFEIFLHFFLGWINILVFDVFTQVSIWTKMSLEQRLWRLLPQAQNCLSIVSELL